MTAPTPQQYANLADDVYNTRQVTPPHKTLPIGGIHYKVITVHSNPRTGYYGVVYQDVQTNAVIVAHRGTEPKTWKDWQTNAGMVANKTNNQADNPTADTPNAAAITRTNI